MELKNVHKSVQAAYEENLVTYKERIPQLFTIMAFVFWEMELKRWSVHFSSPFKFFREWKRLKEDDKGVVDMETLLKGVCTKANLIDIIENFILLTKAAEA